MKINTEILVSITEANQNFSKVDRLVDEKGSAVILKNNIPKYLLIDFEQLNAMAIADDEEVAQISKRLIAENAQVYQELAK